MGLKPTFQIFTPLVALLIVLFLFRGWMDQGMEMDEVSRVLNIIPLYNPEAEPIRQSIFDISIFGTEVPVMFKEYISSAYLLRFLPLGLFEDYLVGLRALHLMYFLISILIFFFLLQKYDLYLAVCSTLLIATAPALYPHVRIGKADTFHIAFLTVSSLFLYRFVAGKGKLGSLFLGTFLLALGVNQSFYLSWVVAAALIASLLLYPGRWLQYARAPLNWVIVILATGLGLSNFIIYNATAGFPTLYRLYLVLFDRETYNLNPIDYSAQPPFWEAVTRSLQVLGHLQGAYLSLQLVVFILATGVFVLGAWQSLTSGWFSKYRIYLLPYLILLFTLALILISPKTSRAGHFAFLIPFQQLAIVSSFLLAARMIRSSKPRRIILWAAPVVLISVNFFASNTLVDGINQTGGTGRFSPAIFEFSSYLEETQINSKDVFFLVWGLYAQPYFLKKGDFHINNYVFELFDKKKEGERQEILEDLFASYQAIPESGQSLYFPLYANIRPDINDSLKSLVKAHGGQLILEKVFRERNGEPVILLYRLYNVQQFTEAFTAKVRASEVDETLRIKNYGPREIPPQESDLTMWFIAENLTPTTRVTWNGRILRTVNAPDHVTALVPFEKLQRLGIYPIFLYDQKRDIKSPSVFLKITRPEGSTEGGTQG